MIKSLLLLAMVLFQPPYYSHCQRLYFERTYNAAIPNINLLMQYDVEVGEEPNGLAYSTSYGFDADWSGSKVIFTATQNEVYGLYTADFTDVPRVTLVYEGDIEGARWSPDGSQIAFFAGYTVANETTNLYVMSADGSDPQQLTDEAGLKLNLEWSPDGSQIAYQIQYPDDGLKLAITPLDGETTLPDTGLVTAFAPHWSQDGSAILISGRFPEDEYVQLYVWDIADGELTPLTDAEANSGYGTWSPDGSQIAFISDRNGIINIYIMDSDGGNQRRAMDSDVTLTVNFWSASANAVTWSADGKWLAFDDGRTVYVVRPDGSELTAVGMGYKPIWRPCDESQFPPGG